MALRQPKNAPEGTTADLHARAPQVARDLQRRSPWVSTVHTRLGAQAVTIEFTTLVDYLRAIDFGAQARWDWILAREWSPADRVVDRMTQLLRREGLIVYHRPDFYTTPLGKHVLAHLVTGT